MSNKTTLNTHPVPPLGTWGLLIGIILIGSNLRAPLTSVGSLIPFIREDLGISSALAGTITTLPLLAFAFLSPFAPKIAGRIGMEWTIFFSLILLTIGIVARSYFGVTFLFAGTVFIGLAIAIGNVLIPGVIKLNFPYKVGVITGIYAVFMNVFGAMASGISVPLSSLPGFGWEGSLASWGALSVVAILTWIPQIRNHVNRPEVKYIQQRKEQSLWKSPLAWCITMFMGIQSLIFYTMATWLPVILQTYGYTPSEAGWMLSLMQLALMPITFIVPVAAEKMRNQRLLSMGTGALFMFGIAGLLLGIPSLFPISVIFIGIGSGSAFSLAMMFFSLRTSSGQQAAEMSGMAQSFGYLLAACGPVAFGALHDLTNGWTIPLIVLTVISGVIVLVGAEAGKNKLISESPGERLPERLV